jgi:hypothetical protein
MRLGRSARAHTTPEPAVTSPLWMPCVRTGRERTNAGAPWGNATTDAPAAAPALMNWRRLRVVMGRDLSTPRRARREDPVKARMPVWISTSPTTMS